MRSIIAISVVTVIVILSFIYPRTMLNPGQLTKYHQEQKDNCLSCHKPFWGIDNNNCIKCHALSEIGKNRSLSSLNTEIKNVSMFHSKLKRTDCTSCHTDHIGLNSEISISEFNHEILSSDIKENCTECHLKPANKLHEQLSVSCYSCHNTNDWKLKGKFDHSMIQSINKNECKSCHKSPDDEFHVSINDNCNKCHNTGKWSPSDFDHSMYFILDRHHNSGCITCHTQNKYSDYTCYGCHEHNESKIIRKHSEEGIQNISDCVSCHKNGNEHDVKGNFENENKNEMKKNSGNDKKRNEFRKEKDHNRQDDDEKEDDD